MTEGEGENRVSVTSFFNKYIVVKLHLVIYLTSAKYVDLLNINIASVLGNCTLSMA